MILLSGDHSLLETLVVVAVIAFFVVIFIVAKMKQAGYMKQQKESGTDKKKVTEAMQNLMGDRFTDYTYAVGYYTKEERQTRKIIYYYYPYILAFSSNELIIFPFIVKDGELILRNRLDIDWKETRLDYSVYKKGTKLHICLAGEWMPIFVHKVIESNGVEKSDRPLAVYQEQEVERLISLLPQFKSMAAQN